MKDEAENLGLRRAVGLGFACLRDYLVHINSPSLLVLLDFRYQFTIDW